MCMPMFISVFFTMAKVRNTSSGHQQMGKQNVVHTCSGILFSCKKEYSSDTSYSMDEPWKHYAKYKPGTKGQILFSLYEVSRIVRSIPIATHITNWPLNHARNTLKTSQLKAKDINWRSTCHPRISVHRSKQPR